MTREVWRWIEGHEGLYMVSNLGRVMSVPTVSQRGGHKYRKPGMEIKPQDNGRGYKFVALYKDGSQLLMTVHRLVASAFLENPEEKPDVNHKDGDKANNKVDNLEWVTKSENMRHASEILHVMGSNRRFCGEEILAIREDKRTEREIAETYGVAQSVINRIRLGRTYKSFDGEVRPRGRERQRKLTTSQAIEIKTSAKTGKELAEKYGVSTATISKIRNNKRYKEAI